MNACIAAPYGMEQREACEDNGWADKVLFTVMNSCSPRLRMDS